MKVYMSGVTQFGFVPERTQYELLNEAEKQILNKFDFVESFTYLINNPMAVDILRKYNIRIFLVPHFNVVKSPEIDIRDYCKFININQDVIYDYSVLFVNHDPLQTYRNQLVMQDLGFKDTIPYFNINGDYRFLNYYSDNYSRMMIGGLHGSQKDAVAQVNKIPFKLSMELHGHYLISQTVMEEFGWSNCDTEVWRRFAHEGVILFNNKVLPISKDSKSIQSAGKHFLNMSLAEQELINKEIQQEGFSVTRLINSMESRAIYNMNALSKVQLNVQAKPKSELFN